MVALSANAMPRDIEKGLEAGFFRYLTKPIKVNEFMDTLDVALKFAQDAIGPRNRGGDSMMIGAPDILNASILIVDDQEPNVSLLEQLLSEAGYTRVASTMNPQEVCALHRKNRYDLILLDLQMPGMDGFQVMEGLKTNDADGYLPVIVLTAQPGHKLRALQAGAKDFISKPFDLVEVKTRIHNMLEVRLLYKKLENYNKVLEQTVQERTAELRESEARYRSLTELASDWYWEQDENGNFTKVSGPVLEMLGIRVDALAGEASGDDGDGLERGGAGSAAGKDRRPAAVPGFRVQPRQCRWLAAAVSGERGADVQPVLPLHRLPRHRRGTHRQEIERRISIARHVIAPQPQSEPSSRRPARGGIRAPGAASGTGPDAARRNALRTRRPVAARLFPHHRHRVAALRHGVRRIGRNRGRGQRRRRRHFAVHGRRYHAQLGRRADRGPRLPAAGRSC